MMCMCGSRSGTQGGRPAEIIPAPFIGPPLYGPAPGDSRAGRARIPGVPVVLEPARIPVLTARPAGRKGKPAGSATKPTGLATRPAGCVAEPTGLVAEPP